ncbi:DUF2397 domain-containing protein [Streptomyces sp. NBC_01317]|uniref:DUF2397 family protein n=1 Tax=Streptomyces sp. NBC_01317 TaxID=2903822 RepID=UPI002E14ADAE|nr:DUF2397 domain-containing protein [Streptomyces sp. NBC_01317]
MTVTAPSAFAGPLPAPSGFGPFAHLTVPNTPLYRHVMGTFLTAKERFAVHLRPEDVHTALPADVRSAEPDAVVGALDRLVGRGNLRADPDTARVTFRPGPRWRQVSGRTAGSGRRCTAPFGR